MEENFFAQILLDLQDRISAEVPEIRYIDQNIGQLGQVGEDDKPPLSYPAVLIDFPNTNYSNLATNSQLGISQIAFLLIDDVYSQTWHQSPQDVKIKGLEYLQLEQKLHQCLQGWNLDYFTPLSRQNIRSQNNNDVGLRVRELIYETQYEDYMETEVSKDVEFTFKGYLNTN